MATLNFCFHMSFSFYHCFLKEKKLINDNSVTLHLFFSLTSTQGTR
jgi:hypothetical protein